MSTKKMQEKIFIVTPGHAVQFGDSPVLTEGTFFSCSERGAEYHVRNGHARLPLDDEIPSADEIVFEVQE
jgi:hypothetical protein